MADISADTLAELARARNVVNTRVRYDDQIELSSDNLFSNPDMRDFDPEGNPDNLQIAAPRDPVGWGVLIKRMTGEGEELTHQDTGPLPMDRDYYYQKTDLVKGAPPQDRGKRAKIGPPTAFHVKVEGEANSQLFGGVYGIAYGWIMARGRKAKNPMIWGSPFMTDPSPRAYMTITGGQSLDVPLSGITPPEHAVGMYIATTGRHDDENAAAQGPLFIQRKWDIRNGMPTTWQFDGPLRREGRAPTSNKTFVGGGGSWGAVRWKRRRSNYRQSGFVTKLNWQYMTETGGWSKPQSETKEIGTGRFVGRKMGIHFRPVKHPANAKMWRPLYFWNAAKQWFAMEPRPINQWAILHHTNPERYPEGRKPEAFEYNRATREEDATGIPAPDSPLEPTLGDDLDKLQPGRYRIRTVFYDEEANETAPSFPIDRKIALGETLKISRPRIGNVLYNSDGHEFSATIERPAGWEFVKVKSPGVVDYGFERRHTFFIQDESGDSGEEVVAKSAWSDLPEDLDADKPYAVRVISEFVNRVSGSFRVYIESRPRADISQPTAPDPSDFPGGSIPNGTLWEDTSGTPSHPDVAVLKKYTSGSWVAESPFVHNTDQARAQNSGGANLSEMHVTVLAPGETRPETGLDKNGWVNIPDYPETEGRAQIRVVYAVAGTRDFANLRVHFLGQLAGESFPRTYPGMDQADAPDVDVPAELDAPNVAGTDGDSYEYKKAGVCRLAWVEDSERPAELQGKFMRFVEYWSPWGTPSAGEHGMIGYTTPVQEETQYTVSAYLEHRGVTQLTDVLGVGCFDARGTLLDDTKHLKVNVLGSTAGFERIQRTFTTPENTAYIRVHTGGFSDGFWRAGGFMLKQGANAGVYTNHNELSGSRVYRLDTGVPGIPSGSQLEFLGEVAEWVSGGAVFTDNDHSEDGDPGEPDTRVSVEMRSSPTGHGGSWSPWYTDFASVPKQRVWEFEVNLTSDSNTESPLVDSVGLELIRPHAQLLRPDGKEFNMPVQVVNFPVPTPERTREMFLSDNNTPRFNLRGRDLHYADGFDFETYSDGAVRGVGWSAIRDEGLLIVEDYYANRRYLTWLEESPRFVVDRDIYREWDPYYIHRAEGLSAVVPEQETLNGEDVFFDE